jgi:hypothetical protein
MGEPENINSRSTGKYNQWTAAGNMEIEYVGLI